ncbi:Hypothetical Protein FCC1311_018872 [Hondaea fermentalgiana]|uniref:Thioesterase domain-containing protein n=1 Tax=Hondaea fermentalgiana TaxID=2315210 RepID=A0A2R5G792_9STRA|nr:Hypothetical Protein FCC1311_018872 [Hondaea fermentalgiana]|eukprot:GBG25668.1 Hypothetical Protein FCC1311_018872 [Hondaea fermentalgiana]
MATSETPEEDFALFSSVADVMRELTQHRSNYVPHETVACDIVLDSRGRLKSATGLMSFVVEKEMLNAGGNLFGGYVPSLTDSLTTVLLLSCNLRTERTWVPSMSTSLNVDFLDGVSLGKTVFVEIHINRIGKNVAFTDADFYRGHPSEGALLYKARHQVVLLRGSPNMENNVRKNLPKHQEAIDRALEAYDLIEEQRLAADGKSPDASTQQARL